MRDPARFGRARVAGLVAAVLLSVGAFAAGALPDAGQFLDLAAWPVGHWSGRPTGYWVGLAVWFAGLALLATTWWRLGLRLARLENARLETVPLESATLAGARATGAAYARTTGAAPHDAGLTRWLLVTAAIWAAPLLVAPPMGSRDSYSYACQGALWLDGADPYRVGAEPGGCAWSSSVAPDWRDTPAPYGPLAIALAGAAVAAGRALGGSDDTQLLLVIGVLRVVALAGALLVAGFLPRLARAGGVDPAPALWLALLSPLAAVHLVGGAHNDALLVGLVVTALAVAASAGGPDRTLVAGAALGAAVAIKVTAVLAVPFAVLLAAMVPARAVPTRAVPTRAVPARAVTGTAVVLTGAAVAVFATLSVATGLDLGWISALGDTGQLVQWTSPPTGVGMAVGYLLWPVGGADTFATAVVVARAVGAGLLVAGTVVGVGVVTWRALRGTIDQREMVTACGLAFAGFALLAPVFYPWYALAPLAVLAAGVTRWRWRRRLAAGILVVGFLVLPDGLGLAVLTKLPGALVVLLLITALAVRAVRRRTRLRASPGRRG